MYFQCQFDITVASEIMAILALTTDLKDMRKRYCEQNVVHIAELELGFCTHGNVILAIIYMKKLFDSDWLRAMQLLCNSVQKCVIPCNCNCKKIQSDWPRNIAIQNKPITHNKKFV